MNEIPLMAQILQDGNRLNKTVEYLNKQETELLDQAIHNTNLKIRYELYNRSKILKHIATELLKWDAIMFHRMR